MQIERTDDAAMVTDAILQTDDVRAGKRIGWFNGQRIPKLTKQSHVGWYRVMHK